MLSKNERKTMDYIFEKCLDKQSTLISPTEIKEYLAPKKITVSDEELDKIINNLMLDNYIDVVNSDKNGELIYCISLKTKGEGYLREKQQRKKTTYLILARTVALAVVSFVVTLILKAIFKF